MDNAMPGHFEPISEPMGSDEIGELAVHSNTMSAWLEDLIEDVYVLELQQKSLELERVCAELKYLQAQIDPHFLFNTLNGMLVMCIRNGYTELADVVRALAKIMRRMTDNSRDTVLLSEEIEFVRMVLRIYQKRSSRLTSTKRKEAFCDYRSQVNQALTLAWSDAVCLPDNAHWQLITWGAPIPYEVSLTLVEAAARCGVTATLHIIREEEWLVLQAEQPIGANLLERIVQRVQQEGRNACLLPSELKPYQFFTAREAIQNRRQKENKLADMLPREKLNRLSAHKSHESAVEALLRMAKEPGGETLTLESAAQKIGYNTAYLGRLFKKEMHQSFQNDMKHLRLTRIAQALPEQPEISAQELALQAGFYDYPTFYKWFKSKYGCSPDQYRLMHSRRNYEHRSPKEPCRKA